MKRNIPLNPIADFSQDDRLKFSFFYLEWKKKFEQTEKVDDAMKAEMALAALEAKKMDLPQSMFELAMECILAPLDEGVN